MDQLEFNLLLAGANTGNIETINKLHDLYATTDFTLKNFKKEDINYYLSLPDEPYTLYQIALLTYLFDNIESSKEYLVKSMNKGCSQAYVLLALFVDNEVIEYDSTFDQLINESIKMKNSNAYIERALKLDDDTKIILFKDAIKLGNRSAYHELGLYYHDNKKYKLAKKYYEKSIASGIHLSYFNLGVMYREGEGIDKDFQRGMKLFKTAREYGCNRAATVIGTMYITKNDNFKAEKYFVEAINNGDSLACYNFGLMHKRNGNMYEAMRCFVEGAKRGNKSAKIEATTFGIYNLDITDEEIKKCCDLYEMTKYFGANDYY